MNAPARLTALLPQGRGLPEEVWRSRHHLLVVVALGHAVALAAFGLYRGQPMPLIALECAAIAAVALAAVPSTLGRPVRAALVTLSLAMASTVLVQVSGGRSEAHFHAFIVIALVALYQQWTPFLLAILDITLGLALLGAAAPGLAHSHPDAIAHPWRWGLVQVVALLGESAALAALWTGAENLRNRSDVVLDAAGEAVLGLARHGVVTFANPAAARLFGVRPHQLVGRDIRHLLRGVPLQLAPSEGRLHQGTVRRAERNVPIEWSIAPKERAGLVIGWVLVVRDVTTRRELEHQLEVRTAQQAVVAQLGQEALASTSLDQFLAKVAAEVTKVLEVEHCKVLELAADRRTFLLRAGVGWRAGLVGQMRVPADLHSQAGFSLLQDAPVVVEDLRRETRFSGAQLLQEHRILSGISALIQTREGPFGVIGVHATVPRRFTENDTNFLQAVAHLMGATIERLRAEEELAQHRRNLEVLVASRTAELTQANRELEAFSYTVSHDLRSPLRSIDGFSRILLQRHGSDLPEESRELLERLSDGALRMGNLIESVLSLSRIGRAPLADEPVDLSGLAQELLAGLRARDPARRVRWTIEPGLVAHGDPGLLRIALENLLGNAWKFTARTDPAEIAVQRVHGEGGGVFAVRDNGAGFDMEHSKELFQPFHRLHRSTEFQGTGIGLATVARIVQRHGGRIWASAVPGQGATFFFTLGGAPAGPVARLQEADAAAPAGHRQEVPAVA